MCLKELIDKQLCTKYVNKKITIFKHNHFKSIYSQLLMYNSVITIKLYVSYL